MYSILDVRFFSQILAGSFLNGPRTEMEFLDSSLLLHAIHSPFYGQIVKKPYYFREPKKLESIHEWHFVERKNEDIEKQTKT